MRFLFIGFFLSLVKVRAEQPPPKDLVRIASGNEFVPVAHGRQSDQHDKKTSSVQPPDPAPWNVSTEATRLPWAEQDDEDEDTVDEDTFPDQQNDWPEPQAADVSPEKEMKRDAGSASRQEQSDGRSREHLRVLHLEQGLHSLQNQLQQLVTALKAIHQSPSQFAEVSHQLENRHHVSEPPSAFVTKAMTPWTEDLWLEEAMKRKVLGDGDSLWHSLVALHADLVAWPRSEEEDKHFKATLFARIRGRLALEPKFYVESTKSLT